MDYFDTLTWQGNSRAMMNAVIDGTPILFRGMLKNKVAEWAQAQGLTVIDEDTVFRAVDELAPRDMAENQIKPQLEAMRTK